MSLLNRAWNNSSFSIFSMMIGNGKKLDYDGEVINNNVIELEEEYRKDMKNARYLFDKCQKSTLDDLSNVINDGLKKYDCGFNDTLLFLAKMIDSNKFMQNLQNVTSTCLSNEKRNIYSYTFFKHNLLNSNVWALNVHEKEANKEKETESKNAKTDEINEQIKELKDKIDASRTFFPRIKQEVIDNELNLQKTLIK